MMFLSDIDGPKGEPQQVHNPRRILFLGPPQSGVLSLLKDLTGSSPDPRPTSPTKNDPSNPATSSTTAGLNHSLSINTRYYTAELPVWLDELPSLDKHAVEVWKQDFSADEARDVIKAVGAWVVVFRLAEDPQIAATTREWLSSACAAVRSVVAKAHDGLDEEDITEWDGVMLAVGVPSGQIRTVDGFSEPLITADDWDDTCFPYGFEYVDAGAKPTSEQSGLDKVGLARIKEALEANEWQAFDDGAVDEEEFTEFEEAIGVSDSMFGPGDEKSRFEEGQGFGLERAEMEREFAGLKMELDGQKTGGPSFDAQKWEADQQHGVEQLEDVMRKLQVVKERSADLPEPERKRLAAKAVQDVMKGFGD